MGRGTAVARMRVQDAQTAIIPEQEGMRNAEKAGSTTRKPGNTVKERLNAIDDTRRDLASSDNEEDGDDEENDEEDTELDKVSEDDEPGWMMGAISTTVRQHMEIFGTSR